MNTLPAPAAPSSFGPVLPHDVGALLARVHHYESELAERDAAIARRDARIEHLQEQVRLLLARRFASSSERLPDGQLGLFNEAESVPVLDALRAWLDHTRPKVLPSAPLGKALRYLHNQWNALVRFCDEACPRESGGPLRHRHQPRRERHPTVLPRTAKLAVLRHHGRRQRQRTALLAH